MEFTQDLSAFQGVLLSADNTFTFSDLSSRGGNQDNIKSVIKILKDFLYNRKFLNGNEHAEENAKLLRRFAFYIFLNSDLNILNEMAEMEGIATVIWTIPTIPKCLMCEIIWGLHLDRFMYEVVTLSNPQLGLEVAASFVDNIKYCTPTECHGKVKLLSAALYKLICRLHFYKFDNIKLTGTLTSTFTLYQKCLKFFTEPPNREKLKQFNENELYMFIGSCLQSVLLLIEECLDLYINTQEYDCCDNLYSFTCNEEMLSKETLAFKMCDSPVSLIEDCLNNCNNELLDKCKAVVMEVSVDIFCFWSEYEQNEKSFQETIGEICYRVHQKITNISSLAEHPVVTMLQQIARKPAEYKDLVNSTDSNIIIEKINNNHDDKASWVAALIHKENLCQDLTFIKILDANIDILNTDHCNELYKILLKFMTENEDAVEEIKTLAIKSYKKVDEQRKFEILEEIYANKCFKNNESNDFNNMMTEIFNKLIAAPDDDLSDILCVFLQNPESVYDKIFHIATESIQQSQIMLKVAIYLNRFSGHFYKTDTEPCIITVAQKYFKTNFANETIQNNFLNFIFGLKTENVIPSAKLLLLIVMPNLHRGLISNNVNVILCQVKLISLAFSLDELITYRAPMLAMIGQILETVRWKLNTFVPLAPVTVEQALQIQQTLFETYKSQIPEKENSWLKTKLKNLHPLNQYYYKELWSPTGNNFLEVIVGRKIRDINFEDLAVVLSKILVSSIKNEWFAVWDSLSVFGDAKTLDVIHKAVLIATVAEKTKHSVNTAGCIHHLYTNFFYIIRYKYFKETVSDMQVTEIMERLASAVDIMHVENMESIVTILTPLFSFIVEKNKNQAKLTFDILRAKYRHQVFLNKINQMFSNGC